MRHRCRASPRSNPSCITDESYYLLVMFNVSEGGDPMSSEISVSGAGNGKGVFSTGQPSL
ncbi:hypothetical protein AGR7C_Cc230083 [Agrobacterium deltaense Zutra 3/1]|uniref:Uncharacterized protein n=1 Tax=Agrobacterium deltaense Zutra 3/1 TaxID=1183427 RepID=A0A1S7Q0N9_9HYPH|nr:hypothetical protein AGR7C_Cc230083 [Agrobacterium deltaense Zutra 3/1]